METRVMKRRSLRRVFEWISNLAADRKIPIVFGWAVGLELEKRGYELRKLPTYSKYREPTATGSGSWRCPCVHYTDPQSHLRNLHRRYRDIRATVNGCNLILPIQYQLFGYHSDPFLL